MKCLKFFLLAYIGLCVLFVCACQNRNGLKRIDKGKYIVEAIFSKDSIMNGNSSYYSKEGKLLNTTMYKDGMKNGISINYFPNGLVSDSVEFKCGKEVGYWRYFDVAGKKQYADYYYYGLQYGPELIYESDKLHKFLFSDLNRKVIVNCFYNSLGNLDSIGWFSMNFVVLDKLFDNKPVKNLFAYLPDIPGATQSFSIGTTNKEHQDSAICSVRGHDFIIDTIMPLPSSGRFYYIACKLKTEGDSINKVFIEEFRGIRSKND
jgi:hypothetical protein